MHRLAAVVAEQSAHIGSAPQSILIGGKWGLIERYAVDQIAALPNRPPPRWICRNEYGSRLLRRIEHGFDFGSHIAAKHRVDLFEDPSGIRGNDFGCKRLDASGCGGRWQMARVGVKGDDLSGAGGVELALDFGGEAPREGDAGNFRCAAQIVGNDDDFGRSG
jgi:hypothetical protein